MKNTKYKKWCDPKWWHFQLKIVPKWLDACISMPSLFCDCIMRTELKCRYLNDINWHNNKSLTLCTVYFGHWTHKSKTTRHALTSKRAWHKKKHKYYKSYYNLIDWIDSKVLSNCSLPKKINMRKMLYFWGHTPSHPSGFFLSMEFFIFRLICRLHLGVMTVRERAHITYRKTEKMWPKRCETTISWSPQSLAAEHHFFLLLFVADTFFSHSGGDKRHKTKFQAYFFLFCWFNVLNVQAHDVFKLFLMQMHIPFDPIGSLDNDEAWVRAVRWESEKEQWHSVIATLLAIKFTHDIHDTYQRKNMDTKGKIESKWKCVLSVCLPFKSAFDWSEAWYSYLPTVTEKKYDRMKEVERKMRDTRDILYRDVNNNSV